MSEMGKAMMGTGEASGEGRAVAAAEAAIANPLIDDVSLKGAKGLIINITGGKDITLYEVDEAANRIKQEVDDEANIIYGTTCDERLEGFVRVSIVATGIDSNNGISAKPLENFPSININNNIHKSNPQINNDSYFMDQSSDQKNDQIEESYDPDLNEAIMHSDQSNDKNNPNEEVNEFDEVTEQDMTTNSNTLYSSAEEEAQLEEDVMEENESSSNPVVFEESKILSNESEIPLDKLNEENVSDESSVRRLSLFDNISSNISEGIKDQVIKTEPVISHNTNKLEESETKEILDTEEESKTEFNASDDELNEEFNQEIEEELLDIPTFLRRQAN
jgi:cell division protein FtsZ